MIKLASKLLLLILLAGFGFSEIKADVYSYKDQNGNQVYTDKYVKGAKKIKSAPKKISKTIGSKIVVPRQPPPPPYNSPYRLLRILFPHPNSIIDGNKVKKILASVVSEPNLQRA